MKTQTQNTQQAPSTANPVPPSAWQAFAERIENLVREVAEVEAKADAIGRSTVEAAIDALDAHDRRRAEVGAELAAVAKAIDETDDLGKLGELSSRRTGLEALVKTLDSRRENLEKGLDAATQRADEQTLEVIRGRYQQFFGELQQVRLEWERLYYSAFDLQESSYSMLTRLSGAVGGLRGRAAKLGGAELVFAQGVERFGDFGRVQGILSSFEMRQDYARRRAAAQGR